MNVNHEKAQGYHRDQPVTHFRCRNCRRVMTREECATRHGLLECPSCLHRFHLVGVLVPVEDDDGT